MREMKPYQLWDELERPSTTSRWSAPPPGTSCSTRPWRGSGSPSQGEALSIEATLNLLSDPDRGRREAGAEALARCSTPSAALARVPNTLAKEKEIEDRWRKLPTPQSGRHLANDVEPEVVEALRDAVVAAYPRLSHRYYALKASWLGLDKLEVWDRNAPLPRDDDRKIPWTEARATVLEAYAGFDPRMAALAEPFFDQGWIDAPVKPGKAPGAFAHPPSPRSTPSAPELPRQAARRDDPGPRARPRRAPEPRRRRRASSCPRRR